MSSMLDDKYSTTWCEHLQLAGLPQGSLLAVEGLGKDLVPGGLGLPQLEPEEIRSEKVINYFQMSVL